MITITIHRNENGDIQSFKISGHANYADPGEDIVCSAVSGISIGMINAIDQLLHVSPEVHIEEHTGLLHCILPERLEKDIHEKVQLLLKSMIVSFESIIANDEYKKHVQIIKK